MDHHVWGVGNKMYIFGGIYTTSGWGYGYNGYLNDLWVWDHDIAVRQWAWLGGNVDWPGCDPTTTKPDGYFNKDDFVADASNFHKDNIPGGRARGALWLGFRDDMFVVFGGRMRSQRLYDIWAYSHKRNMWRVVNESRYVDIFTTSEVLGNRVVGGVFRSPDYKIRIFSGKGPDPAGSEYPLRDFFEFTNPQFECSGHGEFNYNCVNIFDFSSGTVNCSCDNSKYTGPNCEKWDCYEKSNSNPSVCNSRGKCIDHNVCKCNSGVTGSECKNYTCYNKLHNATDVCSGKGICWNPDICNCSKNYTLLRDCSRWKCFGKFNNESSVCSYRGACVSQDNCSCFFDSFKGEECQFISYNFSCSGIMRNDSKNVCNGGKGNCVMPNKCVCFQPKYYYGSNCDMFDCYGYNNTNKKVCNNRNGKCVDYDKCSCYNKYYGIKCEEEIRSATLYDEDNLLVIDYRMPIKYAQSMGEEFDCSKIISNVEVLGEDPKCVWDFGMKFTYRVNVKLQNYKLSELKEVKIKTVSKDVEVVGISVDQVLPEETDYQTYYGFLAFLVLLLIFPCCCVCCCFCCGLFALHQLGCLACCISCCACLCCCRYRKIALKLGRIKHKDVILSEQKAEKDSSQPLNLLKISKHLFEIKYESIEMLKTIGEGGSGALVYKAKWKNRIVAFKVFKTDEISDERIMDDFEREVNIMSSISHPNILQFYGVTLKHPRIGILAEFCDNGDLKDYMQNHPKEFSPREKVRILQSIASGMTYLHERNVIHRDLKSKNILLTKNNSAKIIDFGLSKILSAGSTKNLTRRTGTSYYMAPEVVSGRYDSSCDVYSLAIMMFEVMSENWKPYGEFVDFSVELRVANDESFRPIVIEHDFFDLKRYCGLMKEMWQHNAQMRPSMFDVSNILGEIREEIPKDAKEIEEDRRREEEEIALRIRKERYQSKIGSRRGNRKSKRKSKFLSQSANEKRRSIAALKGFIGIFDQKRKSRRKSKLVAKPKSSEEEEEVPDESSSSSEKEVVEIIQEEELEGEELEEEEINTNKQINKKHEENYLSNEETPKIPIDIKIAPPPPRMKINCFDDDEEDEVLNTTGFYSENDFESGGFFGSEQEKNNVEEDEPPEKIEEKQPKKAVLFIRKEVKSEVSEESKILNIPTVPKRNLRIPVKTAGRLKKIDPNSIVFQKPNDKKSKPPPKPKSRPIVKTTTKPIRPFSEPPAPVPPVPASRKRFPGPNEVVFKRTPPSNNEKSNFKKPPPPPPPYSDSDSSSNLKFYSNKEISDFSTRKKAPPPPSYNSRSLASNSKNVISSMSSQFEKKQPPLPSSRPPESRSRFNGRIKRISKKPPPPQKSEDFDDF